MRRIKTVAITNVLHEGVAEEPLAREIFLRHLWNEREFKVPYPFPAVAMDEPGWQRPARENCWGYYSQALTALRATRWMPRYGLDEPLRELLTAWVTAWGRSEIRALWAGAGSSYRYPLQCLAMVFLLYAAASGSRKNTEYMIKGEKTT